MRQRSKKTAKKYIERRKLVARLLEERPWCERCPKGITKFPEGDMILEMPRRSTVIHERLTRARGGDILDETNCVALCQDCHLEIHAHPAQATEDGWLKSGKKKIEVW